MPSNSLFLSLISAAACLAPALSLAQSIDHPLIPKPLPPFLAACSSQEHLDPDNEGALMAALWAAHPLSSNPKNASNNLAKSLAANCAAHLLYFYPPNPSIDQALLNAALSSNFQLAYTAANVLLARNNLDWTDDLIRRFPSIPDPLAKIRVADSLAKAGHFDGWDFIRLTILTPQKYRQYSFEALNSVPHFAGMKDSDGIPLNLFDQLAQMHALVPPDQQHDIESIMIAISPLPNQPLPLPQAHPHQMD